MSDDDDEGMDEAMKQREIKGPLFPEDFTINLGFLQVVFFQGAGWLRFGEGGWGLHFLRADHRPLYSEREGFRRYRRLGRKGSKAGLWRAALVERTEQRIKEKVEGPVPLTDWLTRLYHAHMRQGKAYANDRNGIMAMGRFIRAGEIARLMAALTRDPSWDLLRRESDHEQTVAMIAAQMQMRGPAKRDPRPVNVFGSN